MSEQTSGPRRDEPAQPASRLRMSFGLLLCVLLAGCAVLRVTRPVVKIGLVAPFEGVYRYVGYDAVYAVRLALRETNANGGIGGYTVELVAYDDGGTVAGARSAARNLSMDPRVVAVIGHFWDAANQSVAGLYREKGLPLVTAGTVTGMPGQSEESLLCPLLDYLDNTLGEEAPNGYWLVDGDDSALECGGDVALIVGPRIAPPENAGVLLITDDPTAAGERLVALRETGWNGVVAGGVALGSPVFVQVAGSSASGVVFASPFRWPDPNGLDADFVSVYQALGPHVPPPGPFALSSYKTTKRLLSALEDAFAQGMTPSRVAQSLSLELQVPDTVYVYRWTTPELEAKSSALDLDLEATLPSRHP